VPLQQIERFAGLLTFRNGQDRREELANPVRSIRIEGQAARRGSIQIAQMPLASFLDQIAYNNLSVQRIAGIARGRVIGRWPGV
jgi:hypothetical protein